MALGLPAAAPANGRSLRARGLLSTNVNSDHANIIRHCPCMGNSVAAESRMFIPPLFAPLRCPPPRPAGGVNECRAVNAEP